MSNFKNVAILNAYDARNRGDRAIVEAQLGWIKRIMPDASVTIFSKHYKFNKRIFLSSLCQDQVISIPDHANNLIKGLLTILYILKHYLGFSAGTSREVFNKCDAFFICGGGYLYSSPTFLFSRQLLLSVFNILLAVRTRKPTLLFPLSWGPIRKKTDYWACKILAKLLPIIVTRGIESNKLIDSFGYSKKTISIPDVVIAAGILIPELKRWRNTPLHTGSLGIAPINWCFDRKTTSDEIDEYIKKLVIISENWCRAQAGSITIFPQVEINDLDDDRIIARCLYVALKHAGIPCKLAENLDWNSYWNEIAAQEAFLGCRMHACIFSILCGVPTVGLSYQPKFQELFDQLGWSERVHNIVSFQSGEISDQLTTISSNCNHKDIQNAVDLVGIEIVKKMDEIWLDTLNLNKTDSPHAATE
jgi:colanic acid/amylovoran biosynthesis protein